MGWLKKIAASGILVVVGISISSSVFAASRYSNFFAPAGYSALGATVSEWDTGDVEWSFADATTASVSFGNVMVPADATGVTSIKVYYRATNASTTNIYVRFYFTEYENDGTAPAYDQDAAATLSVAGGSNVIRFVTVPSSNYSGMTFTPGNSIGIGIKRQAADASDTLNAAWAVKGVVIEWTVPAAATFPAAASGWLHNDGADSFSWSTPTSTDTGSVPTSRTINGYDLTANRTLTPTDIGLPANAGGWLHNNGSGTLVWSTPTAADVGALDDATDLYTLGIPADASGCLNNDGAGVLTWVSCGGGGVSLPADAAGWLENDGGGTLSWSTPSGGSGSGTDLAGIGIVAVLGLFVVFFGVMFMRK